MFCLTCTLLSQVIVSGFFFGMLLSDMVGDSEGWKDAIWVPIYVSCVILVVWTYRIRKNRNISNANNNSEFVDPTNLNLLSFTYKEPNVTPKLGKLKSKSIRSLQNEVVAPYRSLSIESNNNRTK